MPSKDSHHSKAILVIVGIVVMFAFIGLLWNIQKPEKTITGKAITIDQIDDFFDVGDVIDSPSTYPCPDAKEEKSKLTINKCMKCNEERKLTASLKATYPAPDYVSDLSGTCCRAMEKAVCERLEEKLGGIDWGGWADNLEDIGELICKVGYKNIKPKAGDRRDEQLITNEEGECKDEDDTSKKCPEFECIKPCPPEQPEGICGAKEYDRKGTPTKYEATCQRFINFKCIGGEQACIADDDGNLVYCVDVYPDGTTTVDTTVTSSGGITDVTYTTSGDSTSTGTFG